MRGDTSLGLKAEEDNLLWSQGLVDDLSHCIHRCGFSFPWLSCTGPRYLQKLLWREIHHQLMLLMAEGKKRKRKVWPGVEPWRMT